MRFSIQKDYLVRSVQDVMKAVSSRTTIPILTGIKVVATEEGVTEAAHENAKAFHDNAKHVTWFVPEG